ncbi:unnamed protein product [Linum tenue]|uniref:BHLH domain-containing protein n=1 Tax=Linum tenue TaxID=586396 RepID=A0AAV0QYA7_9ROSI|nr:unnamed protein product [Linum tenue]
MSSRRSSSSRASTMSEDEIITDLVLKLQALLPQLNPRKPSRGNIMLLQAQASKVLKETCSYIRKLEKEVDDLSGRMSQLLDTIDPNNQDFDLDSIRRSLLQI